MAPRRPDVAGRPRPRDHHARRRHPHPRPGRPGVGVDDLVPDHAQLVADAGSRRRIRAEVFAAERPWALVPAPLAPTGTAVAVDGGLRVSGRWEWATGVRHADWVMVHVVRAEPEPATFFVLVPIDDVVVDDVWFMSGMGATGSDTVVIDDVVRPRPTARSRPARCSSVRTRSTATGWPACRWRPVLAIVAAAPALGAAEAATEHFRAGIAERVLAYSLGDRAREQPVTQARLGAVLSELAACRANWDRAVALLAGMHDAARRCRSSNGSMCAWPPPPPCAAPAGSSR